MYRVPSKTLNFRGHRQQISAFREPSAHTPRKNISRSFRLFWHFQSFFAAHTSFALIMLNPSPELDLKLSGPLFSHGRRCLDFWPREAVCSVLSFGSFLTIPVSPCWHGRDKCWVSYGKSSHSAFLVGKFLASRQPFSFSPCVSRLSEPSFLTIQISPRPRWVMLPHCTVSDTILRSACCPPNPQLSHDFFLRNTENFANAVRNFTSFANFSVNLMIQLGVRGRTSMCRWLYTATHQTCHNFLEREILQHVRKKRVTKKMRSQIFGFLDFGSNQSKVLGVQIAKESVVPHQYDAFSHQYDAFSPNREV